MKLPKKTIIDFSFKTLIERYKLSETYDDLNQLYKISSDSFVLEVESYFRELYCSVCKPGESKDGINLFNLLDYLYQNSQSKPLSNYFHEEDDLDEAFRKQLLYISFVVDNNYSLINTFFDDDHYQVNLISFGTYWKTKHPEFYQNKNI